jgi:hypothetical protein
MLKYSCVNQYQVHLTPKSTNAKTGPIPVSTTSRKTCPDVCPFKKAGCYAENYGLNFLWNRVDNGTAGTDWPTFCNAIEALPAGTLWRYGQAGDLPNQSGHIDGEALGHLVQANIGKRVIAYTHCEPTLGDNAKFIKGCNDWGFTVNLSANTLEHADALVDLAIGPVVVVLDSTQNENTTTPAGRRVVICPATIRDDVTCKTCGLCAIEDRKAIIGFPAHGTGTKKAEAAIQFYRSNAKC